MPRCVMGCGFSIVFPRRVSRDFLVPVCVDVPGLTSNTKRTPPRDTTRISVVVLRNKMAIKGFAMLQQPDLKTQIHGHSMDHDTSARIASYMLS